MTSALWAVAESESVLAEARQVFDPMQLLSSAERGRWSALHRPADRDDFLAARMLVRTLLLQARAAAPTAEALQAISLVQKCARCGGPHGRPSVVEAPEMHVNWSHADGLVAAAVARRRVGIDVERRAPDALVPGVGRTLTTQQWVRMEALVKAGFTDLDSALRLDPIVAPGYELIDLTVEQPDGAAALALQW